MNTRRIFLASAVAGSVGIALPTRQFAASAPACEAKPSPADAIESHLKIILNLKSEFIFQIFRGAQNTSIECNKLLKKLSDLVRKLELEILKTDRIPLKNHVRRMTHLTIDAERTLRGVNPDLLGTNPAQLSYISDELREKAQELLPAGRSVLSAEATRLLNDIIKLVRDSAPVRAKLEIQQTNADLRAKRIRESFTKAEDLLEEAIYLIDAGFNDSRGDGVSSAAARVTDAVAIFETLKSDMSSDKSRNSIDVVITLLEGVAYWIKNPAEIVIPDVTRSDTNMGFVNAALAQSDHHYSMRAPETLEGVLGRFCKRDSIQQVATIISGLLFPLIGWKHARAFFLGRPVSFSEMISKIENILGDWVQVVQRPCGKNVNLRELAKALQPFV